jgi:hypothetical protein
VPDPPAVQRTIGRLLRGLLIIQAALAAITGPRGLIPAAVLLACLPAAALLARRFRQS